MVFYIIYPGGDRTKLDIAQAFEYERDDYDIAFNESFSDEYEAIKIAMKLSDKHHIPYVGEVIDEDGEKTKHRYLSL